MQKFKSDKEEILERTITEFRRYISSLLENRSYKRFHHTGLGPIREIEKKFAEYYGVKYALSFSSATNALSAIAFSDRFMPGDSIIIAPNFWGSAVAGLRKRNDITLTTGEPDMNGNIDIESVEPLLDPSVKAVWVTDYRGIPHDMKILRKMCDTHNILYISDASASVGVMTPDGPASSLADILVISFGADKFIPAGEGGMVLTNHKTWYEDLMKFQHPERQVIELGIGKESDEYFINGRIHPISAIIVNAMFEVRLKNDLQEIIL